MAPGSISFYPDETERIHDAELILLGVQPSELEEMPIQMRYDVLELHRAKVEIQNRQMSR